MPMFRQGSQGAVIDGTVALNVPPLAAARAGTVNPAGGLVTNINASGYKSGTLVVYAGVVTVTTGAVTGKVQAATASGGSYADITGAAVTGFGPSDDNTIQTVDFEIPNGKPWLQIVVTTVEATDVSGAFIILHGPTRT